MSAQFLTVDAAVRLFMESRRRRGGRGGHVSDDTLATYRTRLGLFVRWVAERGITHINECGRGDLEDYLDHLRGRRDMRATKGVGKALSPETVLDYFVGIRTFFRWLIEEEYIEKDPTAKVKRPEVPKDQPVKATLNSEEQFEFLKIWTPRDTVEGYNTIYMGERRRRFIYYRNRAISFVLLETGIRRCELLKLDASDLVRTATGWKLKLHEKGGGQDEVPVNATALQMLNLYLRERRAYLNLRENEGPLFLTYDGRPMTRAALRRMFTTVKAKVARKASPHVIRHTTGVETLRETGNVEFVRRLLRHQRVSTTERYLRTFNADDVARIHRTASPVERLMRGR